MSSSSASVLPDVNTNQSLRAASLSISTRMHMTKWVFVSGETITGKGPKGSAILAEGKLQHISDSGQTPHYHPPAQHLQMTENHYTQPVI